MRIIIVDDDQLVSLSLKTILESTGNIQVVAIGNSAQDALLLYQKWKPCLLYTSPSPRD